MEDGSHVRTDLRTVTARLFELRLNGSTAEPLPWSTVRALEEHEDHSAEEYSVVDVTAHRYCHTGGDHGHRFPILELAAVWLDGSTSWVAASALSRCAESLLEHGVRCGQRFLRQRGRLGQLRRTQSSPDLGSPSEFHRRHIRTTQVLDSTSHSHGCTALDRRYPLTYFEAYPNRQADAEEIARYRQWRRTRLEASAYFIPTPAQKCSVQAANAESDEATDRGRWDRPVDEKSSSEENVTVAHYVDDEAEDVSAVGPAEGELRRRMGWRYVELRSSETSETYSEPEEAGSSQRPRKRKRRSRKERASRRHRE